MKSKEFVVYQKKWNEDNVEVARFNWQTTNPVIVEKEYQLLSVFKDINGKKILEVGCGEGANIHNLQKLFSKSRNKITGSDYSSNRIRFAKCAFPKKKYLVFRVEDGTNMSFASNSFDVVFCRDVIHHIWHHDKLLKEMIRVCKKNGKVIMIESNAYNPVNYGFSLLFKKEEGMRKITPSYIRKLFSKHPGKLQINYSEAYNLDRLFFHYSMGISSASKIKLLRVVNNIMNKLMDLIFPKIFNAYMIVEYKK